MKEKKKKNEKPKKQVYGLSGLPGRTIAFINKNRKSKKVIQKNIVKPKSVKKQTNQKKPVRLTIMY